MKTTDFSSSNNAVAAAATLIACAWFFVAGATIVASPTDAQVARGAHVTVQPGPVMPEAQRTAATTPDAHFTINVSARRA